MADLSPEELKITLARQRENKDVNRARIWHIKQAPCTDCGLKWHPHVMTFDHPMRAASAMKVSKTGRPISVASITYWNPTAFNKQIALLDLVCKNCHFLREALRDLHGAMVPPSRRKEISDIAAKCKGALAE